MIISINLLLDRIIPIIYYLLKLQHEKGIIHSWRSSHAY
jgi:hypothetical protein